MARVTVEDCVVRVNNRFELVLFSAHRARGMAAGAELLVERDNDKNPIVALREIAEEKLTVNQIREDLITSLQNRVDVDEPEEYGAPDISVPQATDGEGSITMPTSATASLDEGDGEMAAPQAMSEDDILAALQSSESISGKDKT